MVVVWDDWKREINLQRHGLDFADARERFEWAEAAIQPSYPSRHGGSRLTAVGFLDGDLVTLVFSPLGTEAIAAISLRPASRQERKAYEARETHRP